MSTGKSTGAQPRPGSTSDNAEYRGHHDGSSTRAYTVEQKAAVIRIRRCGVTAFYDILGLEEVRTTIDDAGIKKAYRKLSLLTHPDKNGYDGADEAFKMVSRAFQVLSDPDKKKKYDQFGGDPDNRFSGAAPSNPFAGFAGRGGGPGFGGRGGVFEEEISAEELFRQFFSGGFGGGFGGPMGSPFGPGFVFNLGGGPGIRVHQFGGGRPRRRPPSAQHAPEQPPSLGATLQNLLPLLILFIVPILSSLFGSGGIFDSFSPNAMNAGRVPSFSLETPNAAEQLTSHRASNGLKIDYYVNPADVEEFGPRKWREMDNRVESVFIGRLQRECTTELRERERLYVQAQGWFFHDQDMIDKANRMEMSSCKKLDQVKTKSGWR